MNKTQEIQKKKWASLGMFAGPLVFLILLFFSLLIHEWKMKEVGYTAIMGIAGIILGWGVGFLLSPETFKGVQFSRGTVVGLAFVTGYLLSKVDSTLLYLFQDEVLVKNPTFGIRFVIFLICFVISTINMYIYRKYLEDFARLMQYNPDAPTTEDEKS